MDRLTISAWARASAVRIIGACCLWAAAAAAQTSTGVPPFVHFTPSIEVYPQNFAIARDELGVVYVGNTEGVLEFDGERWNLIALDNGEIVRSLGVAADGTVYVGGYNAFGLLRRDASGAAHFVDLTPRFAAVLQGREFADIWNTLVAPEGVYFRALHDVFFWDPRTEGIKHWHHEGRFGSIAHHQGQTWLQFRGEGFKVRVGDEWRLLEHTRALTDLIAVLVPMRDGTQLAIGRYAEWWRIGTDRVWVQTMPAGLPAPPEIQDAVALDDGSIALAGFDGMVSMLDSELRQLRRFRVDPGFLPQIVRVAGGFLVCAYDGFYRVSWPAPWTLLGPEHGAQGTFLRVSAWDDQTYLHSTSLLWRIDPQPGGTLGFTAMQWGGGASYGLIGLDRDRAVLAESHDLALLDHGRRRTVVAEPVYPREFLRSRHTPDRVYIGTEWGLRVLTWNAVQARLSAADPAAVGRGVIAIVEREPGVVWYGTARHGIWRAEIGADGEIVRQSPQHLPEGSDPVSGTRVSVIDDDVLLASTAAGLFRWDGARFVPDDVFGLAPLRREDELLRIAQTAPGEQWAASNTRVWRRRAPGPWVEQAIAGLRRGAITDFLARTDGGAVAVANNSLMLHDGTPGADRASDAPRPQVRLREVARVQASGVREPLPLSSQPPLQLDQGDFGISFRFALPELERENDRAYRGRLLGYEAQFSPWSRSIGYTYSRLQPGVYRLEVEARNSAGHISRIEPYALEIIAPWYARWWARVLWLTLAGMALAMLTLAIVRRRTRRLAADKMRLEAVVAERTRDLAAANARLENMAKVDGLTGVANRRALDAYLEQVWQTARERGRTVALLAIDVDHFKRYNDSMGHLAGDELLQRLVPQLSQCLRRSEDLLARYGGEEFLVVMPGADADTAKDVAERMRADVERAQLGASVSIGVACWPAAVGSARELIEAADQALYDAKNMGRNRVVLSELKGPAHKTEKM
jgi:diguanylate cyclase (GGDEF)-like protein